MISVCRLSCRSSLMRERHHCGLSPMATCCMPPSTSRGWRQQRMTRSLHFWSKIVARTAAIHTTTSGTIYYLILITSQTSICSCETWRRSVVMYVSLAPIIWSAAFNVPITQIRNCLCPYDGHPHCPICFYKADPPLYMSLWWRSAECYSSVTQIRSSTCHCDVDPQSPMLLWCRSAAFNVPITQIRNCLCPYDGHPHGPICFYKADPPLYMSLWWRSAECYSSVMQIRSSTCHYDVDPQSPMLTSCRSAAFNVPITQIRNQMCSVWWTSTQPCFYNADPQIPVSLLRSDVSTCLPIKI